MLLVAHTGHWLIWVLYAVPILIVVVAIAASLIRQRRERGADPSAERRAEPTADRRADPTAD